ncbi:MAG: hypothetical protein Q4G67_11175 [Actinomycetia bacterium]|nr:hypothetical protein [Actinomycetes bacterium]
MASPTPSRHRAQHGSGSARTILRDVAIALRLRQMRPGPVVAKATAVTAAGGLAFALLVPSAPGADGDAVALAAGTGAAATMAADYLAKPLRGDQPASRAARPAPFAVQAPTPAAPVTAQTFGAMSFTAVEKPPPPPPPPPPAPRASSSKSGSSGSTGSSGSSRSSRSSGGGGSDFAAAQSCSCARGLTQNSLRVLAAVKASFPGLNSIGGVRPDSLPDHPSGRALDFMTTNKGLGDSIANMLIARSGELNIKYIIWYQRIWEPGKGWRTMSNRGSATANHMDHVHVSVR